MSTPGFTGEAALAGTSGRYERTGLVGDAAGGVVPQQCPWWEWPVCAGKVAGCATLCSPAWAWWGACMAGCLWLAGAAQCVRCL